MKIMKVSEIKKYIIGLKKYIIGFILGLSLIGGLTYAADSGSIGALFERLTPTGPWTLKQEAIKDSSIEGVKLKGDIISSDKLSPTLRNEIAVNTAKLGITAAQQTAISNIPTTVAQLTDASSYIKSGTDVSVNNLIVNGTTNINGTLDASVIKSNGIELTKKIKVIDNTWYTLSDLPAFVGKDNVSSTIIDIPDGKYISSIKLSGTGGTNSYMGGCVIMVPDKLSISLEYLFNFDGFNYNYSLTKIKDIKSSIDNNFSYYKFPDCTDNSCRISISNNNFEYSYMISGIHNVDYSEYSLGQEEYNLLNIAGTSTEYKKIKHGLEYLDGNEDNIYLKRIVPRKINGSNASVKCKVEVQYGELIY